MRNFLTPAQAKDLADEAGYPITIRHIQRLAKADTWKGAYKLDESRATSPYQIPRKPFELWLKKQCAQAEAA